MKVFKFGGASIKDAAAIRQVASILDPYKGQPIIIVISALGKTTNALEAVTHEYFNKTGKAPELFDALKRTHFEILSGLFSNSHHPVYDELNNTFVEIEWILEDPPIENYDYLYDQIVSIGEMAATKMVSAYLQEMQIPVHWLDVRDCIRTDNTYREGKVDWPLTEKNIVQIIPPLLSNQFVVTQGFLGGTSENYTTTLGREGSDYTAAIFAYALNAEEVTIWKDVPGIMTGDPKRFDNVVRLEEISYTEAIEMTYYGAKVIHPKTIKPLQNKNIPMVVRPFDHPEGPGTKISETESTFLPPIVVVESDQALLEIATRDFSFVAEEHLSEIFSRVATHRIKVNSMRNTALSFMLCVRNEKDKLDKLQQELISRYHITIHEGLELITVRHANQKFLDQLEKGKEIILEEKFGDTDQFIVRNV